MKNTHNSELVTTADVLGGEGLRENGNIRRIEVKDEVIAQLEDKDSGEIFRYPQPSELGDGTPLHEFVTKIIPDFSREKFGGKIDLNALLKGKPCQFIVASRTGAGGKRRMEVVLVLPPNTLTRVQPT